MAGQANTVSVGAPGNERRITNVATGTASTDAVNVSQLQGTVAQTNAYTDQQVAGANNLTNQRFLQSIAYTNAQTEQVNQRMNRIERGANQGVAAVAAMMTAMRTPDPGKTTVSIGGGYYGAQAGMALGMAHRSRNSRWQGVASLGVPASIVSGANIVAAAGFGVQV